MGTPLQCTTHAWGVAPIYVIMLRTGAHQVMTTMGVHTGNVIKFKTPHMQKHISPLAEQARIYPYIHLQPTWQQVRKNRTGAFAQNKAANYYMHAQMHNPEHTLLLLGGKPWSVMDAAHAIALPMLLLLLRLLLFHEAASSDHRPGVTADADRSRAYQSITFDASFHGADQGAKASATYTASYAKFTSDV